MWSRQARAVFALECRVQFRDPATALYVIVYLALAFGFAASGAVELVRDRGALPKTAPLALTLATGGLVAFGQVITTMVTASAFLRDSALRIDGLLFSTPLARSAWAAGRWLASIGVLAATTLAIPAGLVLGNVMPWVAHDVAITTVAWNAVHAWLLLALPTSLVVASTLAAVAVISRRLITVLAVALVLVFLWQTSDAFRTDDRFADVAPWVDPFGTTALQVEVAAWPDTMRATQRVGFVGMLRDTRLAWGAVALLLGVAAVRAAERGARATTSGARARDADARTDASMDASMDAGMDVRRVASTDARDASPTISRVGNPSRDVRIVGDVARAPWRAIAVFTLRWLRQERGWRVIAALGALNVGAQVAALDPSGALTTADVLGAVQTHGRLFCILLATIYAGELVWRDRDERVAELVDSATVGTPSLVVGRLAGVLVGEAAVVGVLVVASAGAVLVRSICAGADVEVAWGLLLLAAGPWLWLPFVHWTVLSLAVHTLVQHKIIGHLLLIAGWVVAVGLDQRGVRDWWWRFADPPSLAAGAASMPLSAAWGHATVWSAVCVPLLWLVVRGWRRGVR